MNQTTPVVDVKSNTVSYEGLTYNMRPLSDDAFTVLVDGVPVGRVLYVFGTANGVAESTSVSEDSINAVAEAWFAAIES